METADGKFMPIVTGQLATGVCLREEGKMKKYTLSRKNVMLLYHLINDEDFKEMREIIEKREVNAVPFVLDRYKFQKDQEIRPENLAIAKIQKMMMEMEINILTEMVNSRTLKREEMLIIDGSLQFMDKKADNRLFSNVIGLSKSFNPNLQLSKNSKQIGAVLSRLKFGERTPVYKYPLKDNGRIIGAWYLRIRQHDKVSNPLDGIVKIEKIAVTKNEIEDGFESGLIDNISSSILLERNVTCHGKDNRWANHIYPMYLTEKMLKESFFSDIFYLSLF